jgi:fructose-1,6-bisphosphatase-3
MNKEYILNRLSEEYPNTDAVISRIAELRARLIRAQATVHVISDIHGEYKKLRHIVNNGSGSLRFLVEKIFADTLSEKDRNRLLNLVYYPREAFSILTSGMKASEDIASFVKPVFAQQIVILRSLAKQYSMEEVRAVFPPDVSESFFQILYGLESSQNSYLEGCLVEEYVRYRKGGDLIRLASHAIRNLLIGELIIAGDFGDRGERIDKVIDFVQKQADVSITWGNHEGPWIAACLGHQASIATVLRVSLRYGRTEQLEEGYGIPLAPLERLVEQCYSDDPAKSFACKSATDRDQTLVARMQKAIAVLQFKLEGQIIERRPDYDMADRCLLRRVDFEKASIELDGREYSLRDSNFPTVDVEHPLVLNEAERDCIESFRSAFLQSSKLWEHMHYVARRGSMYLKRGQVLIFHACVPVDERGEFLTFPVDGKPRKGKSLFDALNTVVARAFRDPVEADLDLIWYLWCGAISPWFGKDKMTTFEGYFLEDAEVKQEKKNDYFKLIHEKDFCLKVLREFGIDSDEGLIVNGHVPVKIEQGESPIKKSGLAVTIDGAFSEAYGDKGYTLVLDAGRIYLAQHHHFESVNEVIRSGEDIIPEVIPVRDFASPQLLVETQSGRLMESEIAILEELVTAYRTNTLPQRFGASEG